MTSDTTGLNLNRTIMITTATIAIAVLAMMATSDMGFPFRGVPASDHVACGL